MFKNHSQDIPYDWYSGSLIIYTTAFPDMKKAPCFIQSVISETQISNSHGLFVNYSGAVIPKSRLCTLISVTKYLCGKLMQSFSSRKHTIFACDSFASI